MTYHDPQGPRSDMLLLLNGADATHQLVDRCCTNDCEITAAMSSRR
jgi:hypothetical protein